MWQKLNGSGQMNKWYQIKIKNHNTKIKFQDTCLYNAKKAAKSWLIAYGFNPLIITYTIIEL